MPEQAESVKAEGEQAPPKTTTPEEKDTKGVPWKNRAMELERKYRELEAKVNTDPQVPTATADEAKKQNEALLMQFVENPVEFMDRHYQTRKFQEELPEAEKWLRGQDYFAAEDEGRLVEIMREHGLNQSSPKVRAKAAYQILKAEKLEREFADKKREDKVSKTAPDGGGKTAPVETKTTRADILKQLQMAQARGNHTKVLELINKLEDTR